MSSVNQRSQTSPPTVPVRSKIGMYSSAMVVGALVLTVLAAWLLRNSSLGEATVIGLLVGQMCFFVLLFGLRGSSWTTGFLVCCLVMLFSFAAILVGTGIDMYQVAGTWRIPSMDELCPAFVFPGAMFAAMSPLWLARRWFGWRLEHSDRSYLRYPSSIGALFVNIVVLAGIFLLLRVPQVIWGFSPVVYWPTCGIVGVLIALIFSAITLASARIVNFKGSFVQFASVLILAAVSCAVIGSLPRLLEVLGFSGILSTNMPYSFFATSGLAFAAVLFLGIRAICADGFALRTSERTAVAKAMPSELRRRTNYSTVQAALVVVVAFAANVYVGRVIAERGVLRDAGIAIQEIVGSSGRVVDHTTGELNPIRPRLSYIVAPDATDADLERIFEILRNANALDGLVNLNLAGSQVSDKCITSVLQATNLGILDLSQTQVTGDSISQLANLQLEDLRASDLNLTSADWERLNLAKLRALTVSGSKFSNEAFATLLDTRLIDNLHTLNVSNTEIDERVMKSIADLLKRSRPIGRGRLVYLSETSISDKDVALLEGATIGRLYIGKTQVTDACVDSLAKIDDLYSLDLSGCNITDASLPKLLHLGLRGITLVDTKVTAKALLSDPSPGTRDLIVREGHFNAAELKALTRAGFDIREDAAWLK